MYEVTPVFKLMRNKILRFGFLPDIKSYNLGLIPDRDEEHISSSGIITSETSVFCFEDSRSVSDHFFGRRDERRLVRCFSSFAINPRIQSNGRIFADYVYISHLNLFREYEKYKVFEKQLLSGQIEESDINLIANKW